MVRLCIMDLIPALKRFLKSPPDEVLVVERCKSWVKVRLHVKSYLADIIRVSDLELIIFWNHILLIEYLVWFYLLVNGNLDGIIVVVCHSEAHPSVDSILRWVHQDFTSALQKASDRLVFRRGYHPGSGFSFDFKTCKNDSQSVIGTHYER